MAMPSQMQNELPAKQGQGKPKDPQSRLAALVVAAKKIVFDKGMTANLVRMIQAAPDPVMGIIEALKSLIPEIGRKFGGIDEPTATILAAYMSAMLVEIAVAAGLVPKDPRAIQVVVRAVADGYAGKQPGQPAQEQAEQPQAPPAEQAPAGGSVAQMMEG